MTQVTATRADDGHGYRIESGLSAVLGRQRVKLSHLAAKGHLGRDNLRQLYWDQAEGIRFATLAKLCVLLKVEPGDLLRLVPVAAADAADGGRR